MKTIASVLLTATVVVAAGALAWVLWTRGDAGEQVRFRTAAVERGAVVDGVDASGAVRPRVEVRVGTQVSGVVERICRDWNDRVAAGETIALLDSRRLVTQTLVDQANLGRARSEAERAAAALWQAERELERLRVLAARERIVSESALDAAEAAARVARADVALAAAVVSQTLAQLEGDRVNLEYATIRAPIDGVIVSRDVDVGQTVAATLQAPTLFVIAGDLAQVQVHASVPEADVGKVRAGQPVWFEVDAHPERDFEGVVSQVRLGATTVQNVVTYTVLVDASNEDGLLLPGMTATVTIELARSPRDALRVPAAALRFEPPEGAPLEPAPAAEGACVHLLLADGRLRRVPVRLGVSDGAAAAVEPVVPGALDAGARVVVGVEVEDEAQARNPFMPRVGAPRGTRP